LTNSLTKANTIQCWLITTSIWVCFSKNKRLCSSEGRSSRYSWISIQTQQLHTSLPVRIKRRSGKNKWMCWIQREYDMTWQSSLADSILSLYLWYNFVNMNFGCRDITLSACECRGNCLQPPKTPHLPWSCPGHYHEVHEQECIVDGGCEACRCHLAKPCIIDWSLNHWQVRRLEFHVSRIHFGLDSWLSLLTIAIRHQPDLFP
jgi:hypothetical protein